MSTVSSVQLVLGASALLPLPDPAIDTAAVTIANQSPYQLAVTVAGQQRVLPAYTVDLYSFATRLGAPIVLAPSNTDGNPPGLPAYATATWYTADEAPDAGSYPGNVGAPPFAMGEAIGLAVAAQTLTAEITGAIVASISGTIAADIVSAVALDATILNSLLDVQGQSTIDRLLNSVSIPASGFSANIPIGKYSEIIIIALTGSPFVYFLNESATGLTMDTDYVPGRGSTFPSVRLAAVGDQLVFQNTDSVAGFFSVFGTNRVAQGRYNSHQQTGLVREWFSGAAARVLGNDYNLPYVTPGIDGDPVGSMFVSVEVGNGTAVAGYFWISDAIGGNKLRLVDGDHAPDSDGVTRSYANVGWPAYANQVGFHCTKAATGFLRLQAAFNNP